MLQLRHLSGLALLRSLPSKYKTDPYRVFTWLWAPELPTSRALLLPANSFGYNPLRPSHLPPSKQHTLSADLPLTGNTNADFFKKLINLHQQQHLPFPPYFGASYVHLMKMASNLSDELFQNSKENPSGTELQELHSGFSARNFKATPCPKGFQDTCSTTNSACRSSRTTPTRANLPTQ